MVFKDKPTSIIWAKNAAPGTFLAIGGVTRQTTTPDAAVAQINKLTAIVGISVSAADMTVIDTKGAVDNG